MTERHDLEATLPWMREGTSALLATVGRLSEDDLRDPSALPDWSRAHVVGHVALNAEALVRLATWARTGEENPMYASAELRNAEIEESAKHSGAVLRADLENTATLLDQALAELDEDGWAATVRSAQGREIPAADIPWMRVREVWVHAVDLDAGAAMTDLPDRVLDLLLDDVSGTLSGSDDAPAVTMVATDRDRTWTLAGGGTEVSGTAAELAGWLIGRSTIEGAPQPPRWL